MTDRFLSAKCETPANDAASRCDLLQMHQSSSRTYLCIDLKSFYASVECIDRGLDPFAANLVVADPERSANTICLAITPALKARGVKNRCRLRDVPDGIDFVCAVPRMKRYMEVSGHVVNAYRQFVSSDDMHVYSIDESFIDATPYLKLYGADGRTFAKMLMQAVFDQMGITATAGIGPNLLMAKVALDVCAKHAPDGIGQLDDESWRREIWFHRPITDIWGIGPGTARRLAKHGVFDLAGVCSLPKKSIQKEFGKNGLFLLDHAWGKSRAPFPRRRITGDATIPSRTGRFLCAITVTKRRRRLFARWRFRRAWSLPRRALLQRALGFGWVIPRRGQVIMRGITGGRRLWERAAARNSQGLPIRWRKRRTRCWICI